MRARGRFMVFIIVRCWCEMAAFFCHIKLGVALSKAGEALRFRNLLGFLELIVFDKYLVVVLALGV